MARLPDWMKPIVGGLVAIGLLGLVEGGLRLAGLPDPGLYKGDLVWSWTLRPGLDRAVPGPEGDFVVTTNALGLRGPLPPEDAPFTLILGCSTSFGWGVAAEAAWPARLEAASGAWVVNGAVPGWSTEQARRSGAALLALRPQRVILAFGVRDAQAAARPDAEAQPSAPAASFALARALRALVARPAQVAPPGGPPRVSPARFAENLQALAAAARPAEVWVMVFPQPTPLRDYIDAAAQIGPVWSPVLPARDFFATDPIHLTAAGHAHLAAAAVAAQANGEWRRWP